MINWADEIHDRVKMPDIIERYGFKAKRNRMPCPFHGGENPNLGFDDKTFHCFTCGISGDIITFVEKYFNISFADAIRKINEDFYLNLPIDGKITLQQKREIERRHREEREKRNAINTRIAELKKAYVTATKYYKHWDDVMLKEAPISIVERTEPSPAFLEALKKKSDAENYLYQIEMELNEYDHR